MNHADSKIVFRAVELLEKNVASDMVVKHHYLHRAPNISIAFGLIVDGKVLGVCSFGFPASRHLQISACSSKPNAVIELNRLWVCDSQPKNTESWFVARCLRLLPPYIVVSYADTAEGHLGYIYRALNFNYAGWTDMERKTPRFDYVVPGKHSRQAFRNGIAQFSDRVRRRPKVKYWTVTGDKKLAHSLKKLCTWPQLSWKTMPPPIQKNDPSMPVPDAPSAPVHLSNHEASAWESGWVFGYEAAMNELKHQGSQHEANK